MESSAQFRPGPPAKTTTDDETLRQETAQVLAYNNSLTNEQKAIVEFMRDGPRSTGQIGHWLRFAQDVSRRHKHNLDQHVKLYFAVANMAFDAFISCWETKRHYDSSRPWTLIRHYYTGWAGNEGGVKWYYRRTMPAANLCRWRVTGTSVRCAALSTPTIRSACYRTDITFLRGWHGPRANQIAKSSGFISIAY